NSLLILSNDSDCDFRCSAACIPNTPVDTLVRLSNDSDCDVRCSAAGNPKTPADALVRLSNDSDWSVRRSAAGNPNHPNYIANEIEFIVGDIYVAVRGTNHLWYKYNSPNASPFYKCGCFYGSRQQLVSRIYSIDNLSADPNVRIRILNALDRKFKEVFGR